MDFDALLERFFGTTELGTLSQDQIIEGVERLRLQLGLETDGGRRFAIWCLLYMLGAAPDLEETFEDEGDRTAARDFMDMADEEDEE